MLAWQRIRRHVLRANIKTSMPRWRRSSLEATSIQQRLLLLPAITPTGWVCEPLSILSAYTSFKRKLSTSETTDQHLEGRLLEYIQTQTREASLANLEAIWGTYQRVVEAKGSAGFLSPQTVIRLIEVLASDPDKKEALARIASIVDSVSSGRPLFPDELDSINQACNNAEKLHRQQPVNLRRDSALIYQMPIASIAISHVQSTKERIPEREELPDLPPTFLNRVSETTEAELPKGRFKAQTILEKRLIKLDTAHVWRAYLLDLNASMSDSSAKLSHQYIASLIEYCSQVGCITGAGLLKQIELDAEAYPWLFQNYHGSLIVSYAKLGLLGHSRRCHKEGIKALHGGAASDMDWSLCIALLRSFRQKEAHAIFNNLVAAGQANSTMYGKMIKEYTLVQLPDVAFALFDDACRTGLRPDYFMLCELATASALFTDSLKSSACIQKVITCLDNWRIPAGIRFFICILKGYDLSHQNVLFDSLARKLVHRLQYTNNELNYVLMVNAARRGDLGLAHILAPQVMESLSKFPRNEVVLRKIYQPEKRRELLNLERFPENNFTANVKLSLEIDASPRSLKPKSLLHSALNMVDKGYTPSFSMFSQLIRHIALCNNQNMAIEAFDRLSNAGVPYNVEILLFVLGLHLRSSSRARSVGIFEDIRSRLALSDAGKISLPGLTMQKYMEFLIERDDLVAAHQMLDFLRTLPCDYNRLPYSPLIRYYIARGMLDDAHKLITSVVQHDIPIDPVVIKMYCQVLLENAETADCGNFLRYIHRTDRIASVPYSVFEIFILHCVKKRRIADIEWVVEVLVNSPGETIGVWRAILKRLGKSSNIQDVANIIKMVIDLATDKGRAGMHLLSAAVDVPLALVVADNVLNVLGKHLGDRSTHLYSAAFSIFARLWVRYHTPAKTDGRHFHESKESLVLVLERHIYDAAALGIDRELLGISLRVLASDSRNMDLQEYIKILESVPNRNYSIGLLESICVGFARRGRTRDVDMILELMWNQTIMLDISVLNNLMSSINCMPIPRGLFMLNKSGINIGRADIKAAEFNQTAMVEDGDNERLYNRGFGEEKNREEEILLSGIVDSIEQPAEDVNDLYLTFYKENLARILSIWRRFEFYSTSPDIASYSILLGAYTKAKEYQQGEDIVSTIISMFGHELHISCQWIALRLKRGNVKGALHIFDALGNSDKCNELSRIDKRYMGLHYIERSAFHFFPFVKYYLGLGKHTLATRFLLAMHTLGFKGTTRMYYYILMHAAVLNNRQLVVDIMHQMVEFDVPINAQLTEIIRSYSELFKHKNTTSGSLD